MASRKNTNKNAVAPPRGTAPDVEISKTSHGGRRKGAGKPKGTLWPSTVAKGEAREQARQFVTAHLRPLLESQLAAALGTHKLMLRRDDGTWRPASDEDDVEKALNGDPTKFWIAPNPPNTQAANTLLAYALDKPTEHVETKVTTAVADLSDDELKARARQLLEAVSGH